MKVGYKFSPTQLERLRKGHIGQVAWNKGLRLKQCQHDPSFYTRAPSGWPYCILCKREGGAKYRVKHREQIRTRGRLARYGLPKEKFKQMWTGQKGCCAICDNPLDLRKYRIDHNHRTGKVRGLLCSACNTAIGLFKDSPVTMIKALRYLYDNDPTPGSDCPTTNSTQAPGRVS